MLTFLEKLRAMRFGHPRDIPVDSEISVADLRSMRDELEQEIEHTLQELAFAHYQASIRVSIFKRLRGSGRGSILAIMRPADQGYAEERRPDEALALRIVEHYNREMRPFLARPIACVIWSANAQFVPSRPIPATIISSSSASRAA